MTHQKAISTLANYAGQLVLDGYATDAEIIEYDTALDTLANMPFKVIAAIRHWMANATDDENHQPLGELLNALEKEMQQ